ncbi:carboxypeptidase B [Halyomorpha halys]|uniref:carboxypeptidase B n=1 Tax=Halyomorpha halys TaxID=286706 RepID=UPI0006D4C94E|nr:carboxypeptidase B-like [Halyomorpha halys]
MLLFRWILLVFVILVVPSSAQFQRQWATPRDMSMFGAVFQWFETAVEMIFGYFYNPEPKRRSSGRSDKVSYRNYQLLRVRPSTQEARDELENLIGEPGLEFWSLPMKNRTTDILVSPDLAEYMKEYLADKDIEFTVLSSNLETDIKKQNPKTTKFTGRLEEKSARAHPVTWSRYHRAKDIDAYLEYLATLEPKLVSLITIGKSSEGRPLKVVKVSTNKKRNEKPGIWIDAGMHGREWIAPAVALFMLKQLVENYSTNRAVVDSVDWYIMPLANPDGYEYTHNTDRFWRKSRSKKTRPHEMGRIFWDQDERCGGVDLNRNFDFHWGEAGASDNPCGPTYAGPRPFSEPETKAIADFILEQEGLKAYLTLHSYSQMWLLPWGYTRQIAKDHDDLMYVGRRAIEALQKVHGTNYKIGSSPSLLYPTSGSSDDWAKGRAGIKYSYTVELRDRGTYGFLLPGSQIIPTGRETFAAVKVIAKHIAKGID